MADEWRNFVLEKDAKFISIGSRIAVGTQVLARGWPKKWADGQMSDVRSGCDSYISGGDGSSALVARTTITDPVADRGSGAQETFAGTWVLAGNRMDFENFQGLYQELQYVASIADITALSARPYLISRGTEALELFGLEPGSGEFRAYTFRSLNAASESTVMAIPNASMASTFGGAGWTYADRRWTEEENGTCSFTLLLRKTTWTAWAGNSIGTWNTISYRYAGDADRQEIFKTWENIAIGDAATAVSYLKGACDGGYKVMAVDVRDHRDGRADITQHTIALPQDITTRQTETVDYTETETETENAEGTQSLPTYATGYIRAVINRAVAFGRYITTIRTRTRKKWNQTITIESYPGYLETHEIYANQDTAPASYGNGTCPDGYIQDFAGTPSRNPDGTWNWHFVRRPDGVGSLGGNSWSWAQRRTIYRTVTTLEKNADGVQTETIQYQSNYELRSVTGKVFNTLREAMDYGSAGNHCDNQIAERFGHHHFMGFQKDVYSPASVWFTEETYVYTTEADGTITTDIT